MCDHQTKQKKRESYNEFNASVFNVNTLSKRKDKYTPGNNQPNVATSLTTLAVRIKTNIAKKVCPSFAYGISLCTLDNGLIVFSAPTDSKVILMQSLIKTSHLNVHKMNMAAPGNNQSCFI